MQAPVLIVEGIAYPGLLRFVSTDQGKTYFVVNGEGSDGQCFKFGAEVDAGIFKRGIHSTLQLATDDGNVVDVPTNPSKKANDDAVRPSQANIVHGGLPWHVDPRGALRQTGPTTMNFVFNVVKGHSNTFEAAPRGLRAEALASNGKVPVSTK